MERLEFPEPIDCFRKTSRFFLRQNTICTPTRQNPQTVHGVSQDMDSFFYRKDGKKMLTAEEK
jgi:hypothetical protein